ncbi:hypothetical protein [Nocardia sp. NBC_00403]|uniref:hypothetical protein n=1 Tax=Nocardia sp. NBC_00403 TaxID=2975990 RepID=UPI002E213380
MRPCKLFDHGKRVVGEDNSADRVASTPSLTGGQFEQVDHSEGVTGEAPTGGFPSEWALAGTAELLPGASRPGMKAGPGCRFRVLGYGTAWKGKIMTPTTPSRSLDMAVEFPELAALARTATRLHPYPGAPTVHDSSVGGPLLWPADEPWPEYESRYRPHRPLTTLSDIRTLRALLTQMWLRPRMPEQRVMTEAEREVVDRISAGHMQELLPPGPLPLRAEMR